MGSPALSSLFTYWPASLLAALGLVILYFALFRDRASGRLRCPKCWYDMAGIPLPARCPECGRAVATAKDLKRTRRRWAVAFIGVLLLLPLATLIARPYAPRIYYALMPRWKFESEERFNTVAVLRYRVRDPDKSGSRVVVKDAGKTIIDDAGDEILFGPPTGFFGLQGPAFEDFNNDGVKETIIQSFSAGRERRYRVYIIEARPSGAAIVADLDAPDAISIVSPKMLDFESLFDIPDQTFRSWHTVYAQTPMPAVYYRLKDGALRLAIDKMETPAWSLSELDQAVRSSFTTATAFVNSTEVPIWSTMLERIYAGHEDEAWSFADRAWRDPATKSKFIADFKAALATDLWYRDLVAAREARAAGKPVPPSIIGTTGHAIAAPKPDAQVR